MRQEQLIDANITGRIIGAAIEVHCTLKPGFLEPVYDNVRYYERDGGLAVINN